MEDAACRGCNQGEASPFCVMGGPRLRGEDNQDWIAALHCVSLAMTRRVDSIALDRAPE